MLCQKQQVRVNDFNKYFNEFKKVLCLIIFLCLLIVLIVNKKTYAKEFEYNRWMKAKKDPVNFKFVVNEPYNSNELYKKQVVYFEPFLGSRTEGISHFDLTKKINTSICQELPTFFYRSNKIVYYPKLGKYLRLNGIKYHNKKSKISGACDGDGYSKYYLRIGFEEINEDNKNLKPIPQILKPNELASGELEKILKIEWYEELGANCSFDYKNPNLKCYNELDTHNYQRFFFMGNQSKIYKYNERVGINRTAMEEYKIKMNSIVISKYNLNKNNPNKNTFENLLVSTIENNAKKTNNYKVLVIVPKDQVKLFIKTIKKTPTNKLKNIKGYIWFEPKWRGYTLSNEKPYNPKKYDVLPNEKYDSELSRISNGNLKAKYGRYLTKERYSEDYVAPSIYGNNYNDEPEW